MPWASGSHLRKMCFSPHMSEILPAHTCHTCWNGMHIDEGAAIKDCLSSLMPSNLVSVRLSMAIYKS